MIEFFKTAGIQRVASFVDGEIRESIARSTQDQIDEQDFGDIKSTILRYPEHDLEKTHAWVRFKIWEERDQPGLTTKSFPTGDAVWLYLPPEGIQVADGASYGDSDFGLLGTLFEKGNVPSNFGSFALGAIDQVSKAVTDTVDSISNPQQADKAVITKVLQQAKRVTPGTLNDAARSRIQRTANPYLRAIFQQVDRREFTFSFEMIPNNAADARTIKKIVQLFRENLYPDTEGLNIEGANEDIQDSLDDFVYKFPNKFEIGYYFRGERIGHKILKCYLKNVRVHHDSQGSMTFHPDGNFLSTKIDLTFMEEKTLTKEDIKPGEDGIGY